MPETRKRFHDELARLESEILETGELAERALLLALEALSSRDVDMARAVIAGDDDIDDKYIDVENTTLSLLALQTPVASDLRLLSAMLHINTHLERIGDQAVNIAKTFLSVKDLPAEATVLSHLQEMGDICRSMIRAAMDSFGRRDLELCRKLPEMDDPVDRLHMSMYDEVISLAPDQEKLRWGLPMIVVARQLERVGDNAVDIAEQVSFLITGEFREFTDASHPLEAPSSDE
jgi:phosphate transport system protein